MGKILKFSCEPRSKIHQEFAYEIETRYTLVTTASKTSSQKKIGRIKHTDTENATSRCGVHLVFKDEAKEKEFAAALQNNDIKKALAIIKENYEAVDFIVNPLKKFMDNYLACQEKQEKAEKSLLSKLGFHKNNKKLFDHSEITSEVSIEKSILLNLTP